MELRKEFVIPLNESKLPLFAETIGYNPNQEKIVRPDGYPYFHWIQTVRGTGSITYQNKKISLPANNGVLFLPHTSHSYEQNTKDKQDWETYYLTFDGLLINEVLTNLTLFKSAFFQWEIGTPLTSFIEEALRQSQTKSDIFSIRTSTIVYEFLLILNKYGKLQEDSTSKSNLFRIDSLITLMIKNISNPSFGLDEMAANMSISKRHLNELFRKTYNVTPYTFLINLRIQEAKKCLLGSKEITIKQITYDVGFRSPSHFIATFHKMVGVSPEQYRQLN
ncbi:AraC family transcriptional regulator [Salipaludibacillus sp. HK11]|uniref:AraC family transcriptional regulator n=1 Tax=Salipaludibacillus sp. HK11 TaxID=3394320 RepID=UPI0039FC4675